MPGKHGESEVGPSPLTRGQEIRSQVKHVLENWFLRTCFPGLLIRKKYTSFQHLRRGDRSALELISRLEEIKQKRGVCDIEYIRRLSRLLDREVQALVESLVAFNPVKYALLRNYHRKYAFYSHLALTEDDPDSGPPYVLGLDEDLSEELAGGKAAVLSRLLREHRFPVPPGLVLTTKAFHLLLEANQLTGLIQEQLGRLGPRGEGDLEEVSRTIRTAVLEAQPPSVLEKEVMRGLKALGIENTPLAVRSSAVGEDFQAFFAGQFETRLNVDPSEWFAAYKQVAAGKYTPHALYCRMSLGLTDRMTPMAVLIMPTIRAGVSGILYTRDPRRPYQAVAYMVSGGGEKLAAGGGYQARACFDTERRRIDEVEASGFLGSEVLSEVFRLGMELEDKADGTPQDVEWLVDRSGRVHVVQSRPLELPGPSEQTDGREYPESVVLARGQWVSSGRTSGRIHKLEDLGEVSRIPDQAILVTDELPPELSLAISRLRAVVAEKGSPACHFASIARQAGVPVVCNVYGALDILENGRIVSIDSDAGLVLEGGLFQPRPESAAAGGPETFVLRKLTSALEFISPLSLMDPEDEGFSIQSCRTLHDIVRYVHEAGVREMFSLVGGRGLDRHGAKRLDSGLPLVLHVLDVNEGLAPEAASEKTVHLEQVRSRPMQRLFAGLRSPAVQWDESILHFDWNAYDKHSASFINVEKSTLFSSYAILGEEYLHALLRFGYHFAVVDSVQGAVTEHNYIHFSFKGGGGGREQRLWRVELIRAVLEHFGFSVKTAADLLEASFDRRASADTGANLSRLGVVLGKTVLLDMRLGDTDHVGALASALIKEAYDSFPV
ncbi:MAG: PEP/pyruvate-binding domain-containing protein [Desulfobacteraceae bacterium]